MNDNEKAMAGAAGVAALGVGYLLTQGDSVAQAAEQLPVPVPDEAVDTVESWRPAYEDAEWGVSGNSVLYDDPETTDQSGDPTGANDEATDDPNTSFETIEEETGGAVDSEETAENYAPDTENDGEAPSSGVISDPGDSQVYGDASEQENDDLNTTGNMDDETASGFDRLANYDDPEALDDDNDDSSSTSTSSTSDSDSDYSTVDDSGSSSDDDPYSYSYSYDGGDISGAGL
ncbi:MAG: hypothetical protein ACI8XM_000248 [Haloarculaceae archaeon]|jgi:hypothetical protein